MVFVYVYIKFIITIFDAGWKCSAVNRTSGRKALQGGWNITREQELWSWRKQSEDSRAWIKVLFTLVC